MDRRGRLLVGEAGAMGSAEEDVEVTVFLCRRAYGRAEVMVSTALPLSGRIDNENEVELSSLLDLRNTYRTSFIVDPL
jgi:hypothetical protein